MAPHVPFFVSDDNVSDISASTKNVFMTTNISVYRCLVEEMISPQSSKKYVPKKLLKDNFCILVLNCRGHIRYIRKFLPYVTFTETSREWSDRFCRLTICPRYHQFVFDGRFLGQVFEMIQRYFVYTTL